MKSLKWLEKLLIHLVMSWQLDGACCAAVSVWVKSDQLNNHHFLLTLTAWVRFVLDSGESWLVGPLHERRTRVTSKCHMTLNMQFGAGHSWVMFDFINNASFSDRRCFCREICFVRWDVYITDSFLQFYITNIQKGPRPLCCCTWPLSLSESWAQKQSDNNMFTAITLALVVEACVQLVL